MLIEMELAGKCSVPTREAGSCLNWWRSAEWCAAGFALVRLPRICRRIAES
jgi:hypothetical protein